ncbi:MAG: galactose mutarotase [Spirochaetes bacterium]|nr:galactose mutarotase [Spirochaetota bacterium]MBN2771011.1 galactose mutarotase [Spirochaetota bacterium]
MKKNFGKYKGKDVSIYTLTDGKITTEITDFGASIVSIMVPDKSGNKRDAVLGYDNLKGYIKNNCFIGVTVGRYSNRIGGASFNIDGTLYKIKANEKKNALHGGKAGFDKQLWNVETVTDSSITFNIKSPDNDQGFPGNLEVIHTITLKEGAICLDYQAVCDKKTHVSLTNHSYFNLNGEGSGSINGHKVQIFSKKITPVNDESIPTGEIAEIKDTFFDLEEETLLQDKLDQNPDLFYDINYVLENDGQLSQAARIRSLESGIVLEVFTDTPGIQFYGGNHLGKVKGKNGHLYTQNAGLCLEAQHYPDSPNKSNFPSSLLEPGQTYRQKTEYRFSCHD